MQRIVAQQAGIAAVVLCLTGCVPSLHPLYTAADRVAAPTLPGAWVQTGGNDAWLFEPSATNHYRLRYSTAESASSFEVAIVRVGPHLFMDLFPIDKTGITNDLESAHYVRAHGFAKLKMKPDSIELSMMDNDWLRAALARQQLEVQHAVLADGVLLTAPTDELRAFLLKVADTPAAFQKPIELKKGVPATAPAKPKPMLPRPAAKKGS